MAHEQPSASTPPLPPVEMNLRLLEGTRVRITLELLDKEGQPEQAGTIIVSAPSGREIHEETLVFQKTSSIVKNSSDNPQSNSEQPTPVVAPNLSKRDWPLATRLFVLGLAIYLAVRFIGLPDYPIYFFSDEAIPTVLASDLIRDNFVYEGDTFLPTYFRNDRKFSLGATVYLNILPAMIFGKSVWIARGTAVLLTLFAAVSVSLILKHIFDKPYWWMGTLLLSVAPSWFLHSRTAFETAIASSFFAAFIYFYLLYRTQATRYLYHALIFGALTFYSYTPGQLVMIATGVALLLTDFRYHWEHRHVGMRGILLIGLLILPYLRFHLTHPDALAENLRESSSYLMGNYTPLEKTQLFFKEYLTGLSPNYWYFPNGIDIPRHTMGKLGNLLWITLPLALIGVVEAARRYRSPEWRTLLIALLASPVGAAVAGLGVTRALFFVIPITILTTLGGIQFLQWIQSNWSIPLSPQTLEKGLFVFLGACNVALLGYTLISAPYLEPDYSINGMQYGARQVFQEIDNILEAEPAIQIFLTPDFANGVNNLARFFLYDPLPIRLESLLPYQYEIREISPNDLFVITMGEYLELGNSGKFDFQIYRTLDDPAGNAAFLFVKANYVPNIEQILVQESEARQFLYDASAFFNGVSIPVRYPKLDMGEIPNAFDGNDDTLVRTAEANPLVVEMYLQEVRQVSGVELNIGATLARITVSVSSELGADAVVFTQDLEGFLDMPTVMMDFGKTLPATVIRIEIQDLRQGDPGHVHLWEVRLR